MGCANHGFQPPTGSLLAGLELNQPRGEETPPAALAQIIILESGFLSGKATA